MDFSCGFFLKEPTSFGVGRFLNTLAMVATSLGDVSKVSDL